MWIDCLCLVFFGQRVALKCYEQFDRLWSRGKPSTSDWTHLAAFVAFHRQSNELEIFSMGTGTKCLGKEVEERGMNGCLLHDSHAEVIAKRSLQRLFYEMILAKDRSLLDCLDEEKNFYAWNESIKRPKLEHKLISSAGQELLLKPGKGSPTSSLSCTNKINRWIYQGLPLFSSCRNRILTCLGIEGSLLNQLIRSPICLSGLILVTSKDLFSSVFDSIPGYSIDRPFPFGPSKDRVRPSPMSIAWWKTLNVNWPLVTVDGYPLGQTRRLRHQPDYANPLAKVSLFRLYSKRIRFTRRKSDLCPHPLLLIQWVERSIDRRSSSMVGHRSEDLLLVPSPVFLTARVHHGSKVSHDPLFQISFQNTDGLSHRGDERKVSQEVDPVEFQSKGKIGGKTRGNIFVFFSRKGIAEVSTWRCR